MKKIIKISLLFLFALAFIACEKEVIKPVNEEVQQLNSSELSDENDSFTRGENKFVVLSGNGNVTDPDEEEDFDEDDNVTDPDEEEDFDEDDKVTDPDEEEDFDEESDLEEGGLIL